jgi:phage-related protein
MTFSLDTLNKYIFSNNITKILTGAIAIISAIPTIINIIIKDIPNTLSNLLTSVMSSITSNISDIFSKQIDALVKLQF